MRRLYAALLGVATLAFAAWLARDRLPGGWAVAWTPNIGTEALTILVTIAVVDRIVARRDQARLQPRIDRAMRLVGSSYRMMVRMIAVDYTLTHRATFEVVPSSSLEVLKHWRRGKESEDAPRQVDDNGVPSVVNAALITASDLKRSRDEDRDVLDPELVAQMDAFEEDARMAFAICNAREAVQELAQAAVEEVVNAISALGTLLVRQDPEWDDEGPVFPDDELRGTWGTVILRSHLEHS